MAQQKTFSGARALIYIDDTLCGLFDSCSWNFGLDIEPVSILGRHSPVEIAINGAQPVTVQLSGFRILGNGVHVLPKVPKLQDLLTFNRIRLSIVDRQTGVEKLSVQEMVPNNWSESDNAKSLSKLSISMIGTRGSDESGESGESANAADLP